MDKLNALKRIIKSTKVGIDFPSDSRTPTSTETIHINLRSEQVQFGCNKGAKMVTL